MKYLLLILLFTSLDAFGKCLIINESKIENRTHQVRGALNERCPKDSKGQDVTNILDITYLKSNTTVCDGEVDCFEKLSDLCITVDKNFGRPIVSGDFKEVYCTKPAYSDSKRVLRLEAAESKRAESQAQANAKQVLKDKLKALISSDYSTAAKRTIIMKDIIKLLKD